ncbi:MAG: YbaB/EbfC family nucleoid-associated protein [Saprospiraceae bacterium]
MFDGFLENMKEQESLLHEKLKNITVVEKTQGVQLSGNADMQMDQISIDPVLLNPDRKEELEEILISCFSSWKIKVDKEASALSANIVNELLPPGMDDMLKKLK